MTARTAAQRKADERQRRREAGEILIQVWVSKEIADKVKRDIERSKKRHGT